MKSLLIFITEKLKSQIKIRSVYKHNSRTRETLNADPRITNEVIINGGPDLYSTVMDKIALAGIVKPRSTAVLAQEIFISVSPGYFRVSKTNKPGEYEEKRMRPWRDKTVQWLAKRFGDNLVDCVLHLDEMTPHIHAVVVPLTKDNRLSAFEVFSRVTLRKMQTELAEKLEPLGIARGIPGSKATHVKIQGFYTAIEKADEMEQSLPELEAPKPMMDEQEAEAYVMRVKETFQAKLKPIIQQAAHTGYSIKKRKEYQETSMMLVKENELLRERLGDVLPSITLPFVLNRFELEQEMRDRNIWTGRGCRIKLNGTPGSFHDKRNNVNGRGIISAIMHVNQCSFAQALSWIKKEKGELEATRIIRSEAELLVKHFSANQETFFRLPERIDTHEDRLRQYLNSLSFDDGLINSLMSEQKVYVSQTEYGQPICVYVCKSAEGPTGAEIEGLDRSFSGMYVNSDRQRGAFTFGSVDRKHLVVCQDAVDAISYHQLHSDLDRFVMSTAGVTAYPPFFDELNGLGWEFTMAYGNNIAGQNFIQRIHDRYPNIKIETPELETWNDDLRYKTKLKDGLRF